MSLSELITADVSTVIFNTNDFAKSATVSRKNATVTLSLIVDSQIVNSSDSNGVTVSRNWTVLLLHASTYNFGDGVTTPSPIDEYLVGSQRFEPRKPDGKDAVWEYTDGTTDMLAVYVEEVAA